MPNVNGFIGIKNSQFEMKLAQLRRKVLIRKNIGIDLIDILDSDTT